MDGLIVHLIQIDDPEKHLKVMGIEICQNEDFFLHLAVVEDNVGLPGLQLDMTVLQLFMLQLPCYQHEYLETGVKKCF